MQVGMNYGCLPHKKSVKMVLCDYSMCNISLQLIIKTIQQTPTLGNILKTLQRCFVTLVNLLQIKIHVT